MTITIRKNSDKKAVEKKLETMKKEERPKLADFYGRLKGVFGDGLNYQKLRRDEWD